MGQFEYLTNLSISQPREWEEDGLAYSEIIRQEYGGNNCIISAGWVEGDNRPPADTIYLRLEKDGVDPTTLLLRPDEAQIICWAMSGAVWAHLIEEKRANEK